VISIDFLSAYEISPPPTDIHAQHTHTHAKRDIAERETTMSVRIHLDAPHAFYTNLDFLSGRIILTLPTDETISAIFVKLEGESRT